MACSGMPKVLLAIAPATVPLLGPAFSLTLKITLLAASA